MNDKQEKLNLGESDNVGRVEEYKFEPIKGFPMLNWRGKRPLTSTRFYPAQLKEVYGREVSGWRNKIYWGDNLQVMSHLLRDFRGSIDLIYIDPPFDSKVDYKRQISVRGRAAASERSSFEEKQYTDIWANDEYLQFMYERLVLLKELLSSQGSIYLHCDYRRSHYLKLIMDEVFGANHFRNEIIWVRTNAHNMKAKGWVRSNDHILFYSKTDEFIFNDQYLALGESQLNEYKPDKDGRLYTTRDLTFSGANKKRQFEWRGTTPPPNRSWGSTIEQLEAMLAEGKVELGRDGNAKMRGLKVYLDDSKGTPVTANWNDIIRVGNTSGERLDYPTQKPESLLERIISASSAPGSLVLDCFMGSGTTQAVAMKCGRRFIGADINLGAIQTTSTRLIQLSEELDKPLAASEGAIYSGFEVYNVNHYDIFRNPVQARELLLEALEVQSIEMNTVFDGEKNGRMVKIMPINRISTKADIGPIVAGFDQKLFQRRQEEKPNQPVEKILLVCMGHEPDLKAELELQAKPFRIDVEVVDILRDKSQLEFRRDSEAKVVVKDGELVIEKFYPMNLLQKLSLQQEQVSEWRELVESIMVDWNYDGAVLQPAVVDVPDKNDFVSGRYKVPADAGTIRVKITDLLSESWENNLDG